MPLTLRLHAALVAIVLAAGVAAVVTVSPQRPLDGPALYRAAAARGTVHVTMDLTLRDAHGTPFVRRGMVADVDLRRHVSAARVNFSVPENGITGFDVVRTPERASFRAWREWVSFTPPDEPRANPETDPQVALDNLAHATAGWSRAGSDTIDGRRATHYRGKDVQMDGRVVVDVDAWVVRGLPVRIETRVASGSETGTLRTDLGGYGKPVEIDVPPPGRDVGDFAGAYRAIGLVL